MSLWKSRLSHSELSVVGVVATLVSGLCAAACGGPPPAPSPSSRDALTGSLTVFAAASLTDAFNDVRSRLQSAHQDLSLTYSFAGSQQLVTQIENGAPADVVATADQITMQTLVSGGLAINPRTFARNKLEMAVAPGNPKHITGLHDLARSDLQVVLADSSVPAGRYARQVLHRQGVTVNPVSLELDVRSELGRVELGNADAAIVYVTDVISAGSAVSGIAIPDDENVIASYPVAVLRTARNAAAAQAFIDQLVSGAGAQVLRTRGFLAP